MEINQIHCFFRAKLQLKMNEPNLRIRQMSLDLNSPNHIPLSVRIAEFREDPQNVDQMAEFVDDVIKNAQLEVNRRLDEKNKVNMENSITTFSHKHRRHYNNRGSLQ